MHKYKFSLITNICVLRYKHTNISYHLSQPHIVFFNTNTQIQVLNNRNTMCTLSQSTQIQFLLITRACVLKYKHKNTTSNKNHPYFLDTNKQIQGLINLKRNVLLITNTQIQGLINHKHNNTNTRSKWQAGQVEQVVLGGAGSGRDQVNKKHLGYFLQEPGCLRGLHLPEGDSGTSTTTVTLLLQIGTHSIIVPPTIL